MSAFQYIAIDKLGKNLKGVMEGDSEAHVREQLRDKQLYPMSVTSLKISEKQRSTRIFSFKKRKLSSKSLALLTRQLATLFAAGLPVEETLKAAAEQSTGELVKEVVLSVRSRVLEGYSLSAGMKYFPDTFSPLYCATIAAGEKSGHLGLVLNRLADFIEQQYELRQKIQSALIYPSIMTVLSLGILVFLLTFVVPKMMDVFDSIGQALPSLTLLLLSISGSIQAYWLESALLLMITMVALRAWVKRSVDAKMMLHRLLLKIPVIGQNIRLINTARFSRTFAVLSESGVSVLEAMEIASALITNVIIREAVLKATKKVKEGVSISVALKQTACFPVMSLYLIASGEKSGQLESLLTSAADNQDQQIERFIDVSLKLFEPMMILVMGALVLFIVLAVMLPIFSINQLVN